MNRPFLASRSVTLHYARGVLGLLALIAAVVAATAGSAAALALLLLIVVAWRGCPTCWAVGLMQTREREGCLDGRCRSLPRRTRSRSPSVTGPVQGLGPVTA